MPWKWPSSASFDNDCTLCLSGYYTAWDDEKKCEACPVGKYKPENLTENILACQDCPTGTSTLRGAAISEKSCSICASGWYYDARLNPVPPNCVPCKRGKYKSTTGSKLCTKCPSPFSTEHDLLSMNL